MESTERIAPEAVGPERSLLIERRESELVRCSLLEPRVWGARRVALAVGEEAGGRLDVEGATGAATRIASEGRGVRVTAELLRMLDATTALFGLSAGHLVLDVEPADAFWEVGASYTFTLPELWLFDSRI